MAASVNIGARALRLRRIPRDAFVREFAQFVVLPVPRQLAVDVRLRWCPVFNRARVCIQSRGWEAGVKALRPQSGGRGSKLTLYGTRRWSEA